MGTAAGSYVTEDTYIIVAAVNLAVPDPVRGKRETTISFGANELEEMEEPAGIKPFRQRIETGIAVYAGGRDTRQSRIAENVRQRFVRIISDVI